MPELPEVETIKRGLQKYLVGHKIVDIEIRLPKQFKGDASFAKGRRIISAERFGKGLVINLDNGYSLAVHVKMTGQLLYVSDLIAAGPARTEAGPAGRYPRSTYSASPARAQRGTPTPVTRLEIFLPDKYTHIIFRLDKNAVLYYRDMRQFGWIHVLPTKEITSHQFFKSLGPEPLKDLTLVRFAAILQESKKPIKTLLLDQSKIAGIGNIYANDALYLARIHPLRPSAHVTPQEAQELFTAIETVLQKGIAVGGASEWHYVDVLGGKGKYQHFFQVYHKTGTVCNRCGSVIEKMKLGGRGTFFCPGCQQ